MKGADEVIGIPIYGVNHSLPVAVAAGIVMHEWARRHGCQTARTAQWSELEGRRPPSAPFLSHRQA